MIHNSHSYNNDVLQTLAIKDVITSEDLRHVALPPSLLSILLEIISLLYLGLFILMVVKYIRTGILVVSGSSLFLHDESME